MIGRDFYDRMQDHPRLEWLGSLEGTPAHGGIPARPDRAIVRDRETRVRWEVPVSTVLGRRWEELEDVLLGRRPGRLMMQYTRVVGYYSNTANWNGSKLAELADRQRGNYGVPGRTPDMDGAMPVGIVEDLAAGGANLACDVGKGRASGA